MEKLIELLNEYAPEDFNWCVIDGKIFDKEDRCWTTMNVEMGVYVISKQFWFIKRLVENDKIDHWKLSNYIIDNKFFWDKITELKEYETLLMLLAIQDKPLEFLIEILKTEKQYTEEEQELIDLDYWTWYTKKFMK